jgi:hypothetical protein
MRFIKQSQLNFRNVKDYSVAVEADGRVTMDGVISLQLPSGTGDPFELPGTDLNQRPVSAVNGMIRYNTSSPDGGELEAYQAGSWRPIRFKEPTKIILDYIGTGNDVDTIFGPLSPDPFDTVAYPTVESGTTWDAPQIALNLVVFVENVQQLGTINFDVIQQPTGIDGANETYIDFGTTPVPLGKQVHVLHRFDR